MAAQEFLSCHRIGLLGQEVLIFNGLEFISRASAATQGIAVLELLNVAQACRDATIAVGVITVEGYADGTVAARVHFALIQDRLNTLVDHLGSLTAVGVEEVAACIGFILGTIDVTVAQRQLQVGRELTAPLGQGLLTDRQGDTPLKWPE